ncbi:FAD-binding oxidoreductase [Phytohabitans flavus]|uniref:FAD-linked oxidase n=1 Tax=Phytohabitans flavus TaxID=1076124 RepID=A0A6F8Y4R8_9ACTN|nr:FAD-binding protein [Phytohabitans flavus]BCB81023.1 FAD-linked oxidase [Phytohabitans flavus]
MRPVSLAELRDAVRDTDGTLLVMGAGTAEGWAGAPDPTDHVLETTGLTGVIAYNPADMTVAVRAGTPLTTLQQELADAGQRICLDPARTEATIGGLVATADSGPLRHAYGGPRDLLIGVTVVLADGTVARSGGHVIKNVAGYDLGKLLCGSFGTLGVIAEVVLRAHPLPPASRTVSILCDAAEAVTHTGLVLEARLEPAALEWCDGELLALYEGVESSVERRATATPGGTTLSVADAEAAWRRVTAVSDRDLVVRCGTRPSQLAVVAKHATSMTSSAAVGVHTLGVTDVDGLRAEFPQVTVLRSPPGIQAWGEPHAAVPLMRAVKQRFDPDGRLGPGRYRPWF